MRKGALASGARGVNYLFYAGVHVDGSDAGAESSKTILARVPGKCFRALI